jgi:hypothetical protein
MNPSAQLMALYAAWRRIGLSPRVAMRLAWWDIRHGIVEAV